MLTRDCATQFFTKSDLGHVSKKVQKQHLTENNKPYQLLGQGSLCSSTGLISQLGYLAS